MSDRYDAFVTLLSRPDPSEMPPRRCCRPLRGHPQRFKRYLPALAIAHLQWTLEEAGKPLYGHPDSQPHRVRLPWTFRRSA